MKSKRLSSHMRGLNFKRLPEKMDVFGSITFMLWLSPFGSSAQALVLEPNGPLSRTSLCGDSYK